MSTLNPAPELAPAHKQLHLSGILDSLEARNREAIQAKLAYTEFLALLIIDDFGLKPLRSPASLRRSVTAPTSVPNTVGAAPGRAQVLAYNALYA